MKPVLLTAFLILTLTISPGLAADKESVYERVMRTKELRCGYFIEHPLTIADLSPKANTGKLTGIVPDITHELGTALGLKIIWTEEMNASTMIEGLNTGRYDALCAGIMVLASRAGLMEHSTPFLFTPLMAYVRADDTRFDQDIFTANAPHYTIAGLDGSGKTLLALQDFSKAQLLMLPQFSSFAELFINVAHKKADMTFTIPAEFYQYNAHNPGKLKEAGLYNVIPISFAYRRGEVALKSMLDTAFLTLTTNGKLDKIINKWETNPGDFYHLPKPYQTPDPQ